MQELIEQCPICPLVSLYDSSVSAAQAHISSLWFCDICGCFGHADGKILLHLSNMWHGYISSNGRSCLFILARNRTKSMMCKPKLKLWMGKLQAELPCESTKFCDYFIAQWWRIRTLTAVALNWDWKFVISFLERVNGSFFSKAVLH